MAMSAKALDRTLRYSFVFGSSLGVSKVLFVNNLYYVAVGCTWMIIIHGQSMVFSSRKIKFPGISPKSHQKEAFKSSAKVRLKLGKNTELNTHTRTLHLRWLRKMCLHQHSGAARTRKLVENTFFCLFRQTLFLDFRCEITEKDLK